MHSDYARKVKPMSDIHPARLRVFFRIVHIDEGRSGQVRPVLRLSIAWDTIIMVVSRHSHPFHIHHAGAD